MVFIAVFGNLYLYVQAYKIYSTGMAAGVSQLAYIFTTISSAAWLFYGISLGSGMIILSSILGLIGSLLILFLLQTYRKKTPQPQFSFNGNNRTPDNIVTAYYDRQDEDNWFFISVDNSPLFLILEDEVSNKSWKNKENLEKNVPCQRCHKLSHRSEQSRFNKHRPRKTHSNTK